MSVHPFTFRDLVEKMLDRLVADRAVSKQIPPPWHARIITVGQVYNMQINAVTDIGNHCASLPIVISGDFNVLLLDNQGSALGRFIYTEKP